MNPPAAEESSGETLEEVAMPEGGTRVLPRLTSGVFQDLAIWTIGFGLVIGIAFPFFVVVMGIPADQVVTPGFFAATLCAGVVVGAANHRLSHAVVGSRLRLLHTRMATVEDNVRHSMYSGDASACTPESCSIPVDSDDELGETAAGFNRLVEALAASTQVNDVARRFAATLASQVELRRLADLALADLQAIGPFEAAAICAVQNGELVTVAANGLVDGDSVADAAPVRQALRTLEIVRLELPDELAIDGGLVAFRPRSVLTMPLHLRTVPVGVVIVASGNSITDEDERLLTQLSPNLAVALNNALGHERLQQVAAIDPLTGLYNRRFGMERLGEEFLIVLPGAGVADVKTLGQRVRRAIEATEVDIGTIMLNATVSVGAVAFPSTDVVDIDDLVRNANAEVYAAKSSGRNRLALAS